VLSTNWKAPLNPFEVFVEGLFPDSHAPVTRAHCCQEAGRRLNTITHRWAYSCRHFQWDRASSWARCAFARVVRQVAQCWTRCESTTGRT
jgi:hypothetical protein